MGWSASTYSPHTNAWKQQHNSESCPLIHSLESSHRSQDKSSSIWLKITLNFIFYWQREEQPFMPVSACQKVWGQRRAKVVCAHVGEIPRRSNRIACLKFKRMHVCVGNGRKFVKTLSALGQCYGAEVHYLNSSKHRKLIELRWNENDFNSWNVIRTSCSPCNNNKGYGCDTDSQLQLAQTKSKTQSKCLWMALLCTATQ